MSNGQPLQLQRPLSLEVAACLAHVMALALPLVIIQIFDRVIPNQGYATLTVLVVFLCSAAVAEALLRASTAAIAARTAASFEIDAIDRLTFLTLYNRKKLADTHDPEVAFAHFETVDRLARLYASDARHSRLTLPFVAVFGTAFALIAPALVWILCLALAIVMLAQWRMRRGDSHNDVLEDRMKRSSAFVNEAFDSVETIKSLHAEPLIARRHELLALSAAIAREKATLAKGKRRAFTETAAASVPVLMAVAGAFAVINGQLTAGALAAAILLSGRIIQPLLRAQTAQEARFALRSSEQALQHELSRPMTMLSERMPGPLDCLELRNLTLQPSRGRPLLDGVSLKLRAGQTVAIKGPAGAGKSLILQAMTGRLPADGGSVLWNGDDISNLDPSGLGQRIQLLLQTPRLPEGTALNHMTGGDPQRVMDVLQLCADLGLQQAFSEHPQGMEAQVGRASAQLLPTSVLRRLHIVRALARRPDVILFDEANSGLDAEADQLLRQYFEQHKGDFALVIVSARPSFLNLADKVLSLKNGQLQSADRPAPLHLKEYAI